jgi:hypothetical protein
MALEFIWYGDTEISNDALRGFLANATGGTLQPDGDVATEDFSAFGRRTTGDDVNPSVILFGFDQRFRVTFRFANLAAPATTDRNLAVMASTVISFAQQHQGNGVLLFNGDEAVLMYGPGGIEFGSEWDDWTDNAETAPLLSQFPSRPLPQPFR